MCPSLLVPNLTDGYGLSERGDTRELWNGGLLVLETEAKLESIISARLPNESHVELMSGR